VAQNGNRLKKNHGGGGTPRVWQKKNGLLRRIWRKKKNNHHKSRGHGSGGETPVGGGEKGLFGAFPAPNEQKTTNKGLGTGADNKLCGKNWGPGRKGYGRPPLHSPFQAPKKNKKPKGPYSGGPAGRGGGHID